MTRPESADGRQRPWRALLWFVLAGLAVRGFHATGMQHDDFSLAYTGVSSIPWPELIFYAWFGLYGAIAIVCFTLAWRETHVPDRLLAAFGRSEKNPDLWIAAAAGFVVLAAVLFRHLVLLNEPVADDELTYRFIAQTLLQGRLSNEPPIPPGFLANQFIIVTESEWFGKYPVGHPLLLALGELTHLRGVIVPMLSGASVALTFAIGRKLFSAKIALLGALLLAVSPQFILTASTELSQPTEMFFVLLGVWCLLTFEEHPLWRWLLVGALAWGMSILVRPLPGVLCVCVAGAAFVDLVRRTERPQRGRRLAQLAVATLIVAALAACLLAINIAQSGDALTSGYQRAHGSNLPSGVDAAVWSTSFFGALLRQSFWVFGVPLSLLLVFLARPRRGRLLFWGLIAAVYSYRLIAPKTVVSTTGPIYVAELVPLLCLASASGLVTLGRGLARLRIPRPRATVAALGLGAGMVSALMFLPVQVQSIHRGALARSQVMRALESAGASGGALVFTNRLVDPRRMATWAYHAPSPDPALTEPVLFLRLPEGPRGARAAMALWQREMPERRAFVWDPADPGGQPLKELLAATESPARRPTDGEP